MKFFLCDDNEATQVFYAGKIRELCEKHKLQYEILCFNSGQQLLFEFDKGTPSIGVIFLAIRMPKIDGIAVAQKLQEYGCESEIIFLTASKEHFLSAFDVGASNYLVKNETTDERFESVFLKAVNAAMGKRKEFALFTCAGQHRSIPLSEIKYFEVLHRIVTVHYGNEQTFEFFSTLDKLENELSTRGFVRVYRSYLVSLACIETLEQTELQIRGGPKIPVGRTYYPKVKTAMRQFYEANKDI